MADWATISSLATAGGTLVLAVATFGSIRSAQRAARVAEQSLLAGVRPVLIPSREDDPTERVGFGDGIMLHVPGHSAVIEVRDGIVYMGLGIRNAGNGLAVIHGWLASVPEPGARIERPDLDAFHRQQLDLYIPSDDSAFWQGAIRERDDPQRQPLIAAVEGRERISIDLMYGDYEGGQRTIARFQLADLDDVEGDARVARVVRYWNVDGHDPRDAYTQ